MRFDPETGDAVLPSGARLSGNLETLSLNEYGDLVYGSDGYCKDDEIERLTAFDKQDLALYYIGKWLRFASQ